MSSGIHCDDSAAASRGYPSDAASLRMLAGRLFLSREVRDGRVARQLHNGTGQALTAITMAAHAAMREDDPVQRAADLEEIVAQAQAALGQVRELCALLRPPPLDALGLEAALRWHLGQLQPKAPADLLLEAAGLQERPAPEVEQACFRIAEEAVANAIAHGGGRTIHVQVREAGNGFVMEIRDDGRGFPADSVTGPGLTEMRERARGVGACLDVDSGPGRGTCIRVRVPEAAAAGPSPGDSA